MRTLIIGSNGQLGRDLMTMAAARGWAAVGGDLPRCDITDPASLQALVEGAGDLQVVINAAAYTAVDAAESDAATAFAVNRDGVAALADLCRGRQLPLIHVSTDYVFDGRQTRPYRPDDPIQPVGVYGHSKAEGEAQLRRRWQQHIIVRTSWLFGRHGANFVRTMLRLAGERDTLRVVDDQVGCPTYAGDLADALLTIAGHAVNRRSGWGTYHFCNPPAVTWWAFACRIIDMARDREPLAVRQIVPISSADYPTPAARPAYSVLDCGSLEERFGITRRSWEAGLAEMLRDMNVPH